MHEPPRISEVSGFVSDIIPTGVCGLPRCTQSMPWINIYHYVLLDFAHVQYGPVRARAHADDITQTQQDSHEELARTSRLFYSAIVITITISISRCHHSHFWLKRRRVRIA